MFEQIQPGGVTVVRPVVVPPSRTKPTAAAVILVVVAVSMFLTSQRLWGLVLAGFALVLFPVLRRAGTNVAQRRPQWLEIRPNRISAIGAAGFGAELVRTGPATLQVREVAAESRLYLIGPAGDDGSIDLAGFDIQQVGTAAMAQGWTWTPPGAAPQLAPAPTGVPTLDRREEQIRLRDSTGNRPVVNRSLPLVFGVVVVAFVLALSFVGVAGAGLVVIMIVLATIGGLLFFGSVLMSMRRGSATVVVGADRIAVKYGSLSANVVERSAVATASAGKRWARMRTPEGKQLIWIPLKPKRDEVLAAMQRHGWPISDAPGGITRH